MRIVHALNYQYDKSGQSFGNCDHKIQHGLVENGHYVYPFPVNDICRQKSRITCKRRGRKAMNKSLRDTCLKVQPDLLLLGHAQLIGRETLAEIKNLLPHLKVAQWYVDSLEDPDVFSFLRERHDLLDFLFCTTCGPSLTTFQTNNCRTAYFPNPVNRNIENGKAFDHDNYRYDLIFIGTDRGDPERSNFLRELSEKLVDIRFGIFGSLGKPEIYGKEKDELLYHSKAALNLTRYQPKKFYTSDRIAQVMGNGLLACAHRGFQLQELYGDDCLVTFENSDDLAGLLNTILNTDKWREIAHRGWEISHREFSGKRITAAMLDLISGNPQMPYPWPHDGPIANSRQS